METSVSGWEESNRRAVAREANDSLFLGTGSVRRVRERRAAVALLPARQSPHRLRFGGRKAGKR